MRYSVDFVPRNQYNGSVIIKQRLINLTKIKELLEKAISGKYGVDELYKFFMGAVFCLIVLNIFVHSFIIDILVIVLFALMIFRCFSRNFYQRQRENSAYLKLRDKFKSSTALLRRRWHDRKTHIYRRCPYCKAVLRLPKKRGRHICGCPKCGRDFSVKCG